MSRDPSEARRRLPKGRWLGLFASLALLVPTAVDVKPAAALMKAHCRPEVGRGAFDPIVHHNQLPQAHDHTFFANKKLLTMSAPNNANYADLAGASTTCQNTDDSAAYWIPTLVYKATGQPVPVNAMIAYYRSFDHKKTGVADPIPADLRMIAGNARATTPQDKKLVNWTCNQNSSRRGPYASPQEARCDLATGTVRLTTHIDFPSCWDGKLNDHSVTGNTADFSASHTITQHLAYVQNGACPAGFPNKLTELRITVNWDYKGNGSDVRLSSDPVNCATNCNWTMHGDFWNTWVQTGGRFGGMAGMVAQCVNKMTGSATMCG